MPVLIKDYTWRQTDHQVLLRVPAKDVAPSKVDVFISSTFVKVFYPPQFLFECCLLEPIDEEASRGWVGAGEAVLELRKAAPGLWQSLGKDVSRQEALRIKQDAVREVHLRHLQKDSRRKEKNLEIKNNCVSLAVELDGKEREHIDFLKRNIQDQAKKEIEEFKKRQSKQLAFNFSTKDIFIQPVEVKKGVQKKTVPKEVLEKDLTVPEPRGRGQITVNFTHRAFPTPSRESQSQAENEWLKKQIEAQREVGFLAADLRPEENNPQWLLDKGKSFFAVENYKGAISAYTHAISLYSEMPELYLARSDAQLAMANYRRVMLDTNKCQELLRPHVEGNRAMRFRCHLLCGRALLGLGLAGPAVGELERALELDPRHGECARLVARAEELAGREQGEALDRLTYLAPEDLQ